MLENPAVRKQRGSNISSEEGGKVKDLGISKKDLYLSRNQEEGWKIYREGVGSSPVGANFDHGKCGDTSKVEKNWLTDGTIGSWSISLII